jgi:Carboxypeptidase regulatory-like domain
MLANSSFLRSVVRLSVVLVAVMLLCAGLWAQTTVATGSIVGTVTDPSGAVVSGARVSIANTATGQTIEVKTNSSGSYASGALVPGAYKVQITAKGFRTVSTTTNVLVGNTSTVNGTMTLGEESQIIEVQASTVEVNTEQASVQGVLNANQIENLPVNGRNFLDLAQLEPGVQIQDGTNFDPTKVGYSSISFGGRFGRTARIEVDGLDVSDETVGTTTTDIPASAIDEFQLSQSNLDLSNELTSSGAVNVTTKSGTNAYHGEAFGLFRDSSIAAKLPTPPGLSAPFQRAQYGGRFGGAAIKDKLFYFIDGEHTLQHLAAPVLLPDPFASLSGTFPSPFKETEALGRLDYQTSNGGKFFYRYSYFQNSAFNTFFASSFQVYDNTDFTRVHAMGYDFNTGSYTHSLRFEYLKFQNKIVDGSQGLPFRSTNLTLFIGPLALGPNFLAPQSTPQSNHQIKYDGTKPIHSHILRYGFSYDHLQGGGFAGFYSIAPGVNSDTSAASQAFAAAGPFPGGASNPLNYPVLSITLGNGQGFSTEKSSFGFPAGGLGPDNRIGAYIGDNWKVRPNVTLSLGVRYVRDTGRTDSDLPPIPALNNIPGLKPNLGARVNQPNLNFAPQLGIAWDPRSNGKTVIRAGIGMFYENTIWNNVLFDRPTRLSQGAFLQNPPACSGAGSPAAFIAIPVSAAYPNGQLPVPNGVCGNNGNLIAIGTAAPNIVGFEQTYQANYPFTVAPNPSYIPTTLAGGGGLGFPTIATPLTFGSDFKTPRSVQMNAGIQHEIRPGMVFSADFVRNVTTRFLLGLDENHVGDVHNFNLTGAQQAIAATEAALGVNSIDAAIASGATMATFANNGLTATYELGTVAACPPAGCAFGGINKNYANLNFLEPIGRSVYNGVDFKLVQNVKNPFRGAKLLNLQVSYSLSRFVNPGGQNSVNVPSNPSQTNDQDFVNGAPDNANPLRYMGPSLLDRTHQVSFGGIVDVPGGFRFGIISHFYSPLASPIVAPNSGLGSGEIFRTDFTGDGTIQDPLPGTKNGSFMRDFGTSGLAARVASYNSTVANQPTPAGQLLVANNLFTVSQLQQLGGVAQPIAAPPSGEVGMAWLRAFDLRVGWTHTFRERFTVEPSVGFYNILNFANFDLPPNILNPYLTGSPGSINGTTYSQQQNVRVGVGTGVFGLGAPRVAEFGLKLSF